MDINTGIARYVYELGIVVQMYSYDSLGDLIPRGKISNG